ncbi:MAG: helix-turn-helix domain-containing protein [Acidimicrobiia bacterium]|nr:helix-turn-helix domain-containing protein [Acidimicrobiia bacterium]
MSSTHKDADTIGSIIRKARLAQGLSIGRLAERLGVSKGVIGDLETDRYRKPRAGMLVKVAGALEIDERQLLTMAGYPYLVELPDLPVYLRSRYDLSDEALAHMKAQWDFARDRYDISDKDQAA